MTKATTITMKLLLILSLFMSSALAIDTPDLIISRMKNDALYRECWTWEGIKQFNALLEEAADTCLGKEPEFTAEEIYEDLAEADEEDEEDEEDDEVIEKKVVLTTGDRILNHF